MERRGVRRFIFFFFLLGISAMPFWVQAQEIVVDNFKNGLSPRWKKQIFHGETEYKVVVKDGWRCIQAESRGTASALYYEIDFDVEKYPLLEWSWKVNNILEKEDAVTKEGDDFVARVYVAFPSWAVWRTKALVYVWASKMGRGQVVPSPYSHNAKIIGQVASGVPQRTRRFHTIL
jgi:hypothetical protein